MTTHAQGQRKVRKAVLPVAGLGTRFLPATKAIPKEMLPIVDMPTIQLNVEECVASGIEEIIFVTARGKSSIEDHFDRAAELEALLERRGKTADLALIRLITGWRGSRRCARGRRAGWATPCCARATAVGDEPFAVLLGDDMHGRRAPGLGQLIEQYEQRGQGVVALKEVPPGQEHLYGIVDGDSDGERGLQVRRLVEKPAPGTVPSRLAIIGRYVLPPEIFPILAETPPGRGGEIQLTDGLATLCARHGLYGLEVEGRRFDAGDRAGYVWRCSTTRFAARSIGADVRAGTSSCWVS